MPNPLAESFRYNRWANVALIEACRQLTDAQLDATITSAYGSIRQTLMHIVGGEQTFALRTIGRQHEGELSPRRHPWPGIDGMLELATASGDRLYEIARDMQDDPEVALSYMDRRTVFPASFFLAHALGHSAEHRTQVLCGLAELGLETPSLDGWEYAAAMGYGWPEGSPRPAPSLSPGAT